MFERWNAKIGMKMIKQSHEALKTAHYCGGAEKSALSQGEEVAKRIVKERTGLFPNSPITKHMTSPETEGIPPGRQCLNSKASLV